MRIAIVSPIVGDAFGQERVVRMSADLLRGAGHEIFFLGDTQGGAIASNSGVKLVPGLSSINWLQRGGAAQRAHDEALRFVGDCRPDVVHFIDQFDHRLMSTIARNFPSVLSAHTVAPTCPQGARHLPAGGVCEKRSGWSCLWHHHQQGCLGFLRNDARRLHAIAGFRFKRRALGHFRATIAVSRYLASVLARDGWEPSAIRLVYNPVELTKTAPREPDEKLVVCASRLVPLKGVDRLLRALKRIEGVGWKLVICGDGPQRTSLERLAAELVVRDRVRFVGRTDYASTRAWIASARVFAQANLGPESFGLAAAEASALGVPVVGFAVPALDEIVANGETGWLVPLGDEMALSEALRRGLEDGAFHRACREAGPARIHRLFSPQAHLNATLRVYDEIRG